MTTDREAFLASFKEYLATTPAVELLNDYTYLLIYINHDPYDEQERYQYLVDAVSTVGTKFSQVDTWRAGCAKRQREDDNAFWESAMAWHDHHYAKAPEPYCLSDVPCEETEWLVPDVLPRGEISLLGADAGKVLLLAGEDDPGKVLKGRIAAAGADMSKVMVVSADDYYLRTGHQLCIGDDDITTFVAKINPILLILDPLQSFLPPDVEMASRNQMRGAVLPLKSLSTKYHLATLISMHTNKRPGVSGRGRLADSSDLWDIARSVLMMGRCKNSTEGQIYLSHEKSSYSKPAQTVLMHIEDVTVDGVPTARAIFDGSTDKKDADFMEERRLRLAQTKDDTTAAILNALAESRLGSMASSELRAAVTKEVGCSEKTYNRAYAELVKSGRITKKAIRERDGCNRWYSFSDWSKSDDQLKK